MSDTTVEATVAATSAFAVDLYAQLASEDGNLVFSPYSAAVALAMTRVGAVGETAAQMDAVLHADLVDDLNAGFRALEQAVHARSGEKQRDDGPVTIELYTANSLWGQTGFSFLVSFLNTLEAEYGAQIQLVDFIRDTEEARRRINSWVAEQTRDRIPELVPEGILDELTRLVLTNAIYLKAPWEQPFKEELTADAPFYRLDGSEVTAAFMEQVRWLRYSAGDGYQAVGLPYAGHELSMVVIVPDRGRFKQFEDGLTGKQLIAIAASLEPGMVHLRFPRFEFRTQAALAQALKAMGMPIAFTGGADFSGMSAEGMDLQIQEVLHQVFIAVDEKGTEAAAATAVVMGLGGGPSPEPVELTVNRPFLFLIQDVQTGAVLFLGRVLDPTA